MQVPWFILALIVTLILVYLYFMIYHPLHDCFLRMKNGKHKFFSRSENKEIWEQEFDNDERKIAYEVLDIIAEAFAYLDNTKYTLQPDDEIMDIYYADNPKGCFCDDLEIETTLMLLEEKFGYKPPSNDLTGLSLKEIIKAIVKIQNKKMKRDNQF